MKALILNSGIGTRMGGLTANTCKCLVEVAEGVTIIDVQLKALMDCGITDICITTGPFADALQNYVKKRYPSINFEFVHNPKYEETNYIYSIYLAKKTLEDDILLLHGDLVFEHSVLQDALVSPHSVMVTDSTKPLPPKDFKAVVIDGKIRRVGVQEQGDEIYYAQPLYKLLKADWLVWLAEIEHYCKNGVTTVYAENALNDISQNMNLRPLDITGRICFEIDNKEDLAQGKKIYSKPAHAVQEVYEGFGSISNCKAIAKDSKKIFVVGDLHLKDIMDDVFPANTVFFRDFTPNPNIEEVVNGISLFEKENCDFIISIGGGSAIDVAKCINILSDNGLMLLDKPRCKHLAIPTTAGTGSESTQFAVIYKRGEKYSIDCSGILPEYVILDPTFLTSLPIYHKKSTLLDALCQAIESIWAKGATYESKAYAKKAIPLILNNVDAYLDGDMDSARHILTAANLAGQAINISRTTAAHAMSYKLSSLFGIPHGHAVSLCLPYLWKHLINEKANLNEVTSAMEMASDIDALKAFRTLCEKLDMVTTFDGDDYIINELAASVNSERLGNHPVIVPEKVLRTIYRKIVNVGNDKKVKSNPLSKKTVKVVPAPISAKSYILPALLLSVTMLIVFTVEWLGTRFSAPAPRDNMSLNIFSAGIPVGFDWRFAIDYIVYCILPIALINCIFLWGALVYGRVKVSFLGDANTSISAMTIGAILRTAYYLLSFVFLFFFLLRGGLSLLRLNFYMDERLNLYRIYTLGDLNYGGVLTTSFIVAPLLLILLVAFNHRLKFIRED